LNDSPKSAAKVTADMVVTIAYRLYDQQGQLCDAVEPEQPLNYTHGYAEILPGLDAGLEGCQVGESRQLELPPEMAFGERTKGAMLEVDRHDFAAGADIAVGEQVMAQGPDGSEWSYRVAAVTDNEVLLDLNHPLAGQTVRFDVDVLAARPANDDEIAQALADANERIVYESTIVYDAEFDAPSGGGLVQLRTEKPTREISPDKDREKS